jgi:hypothetical protein
MRWELNFEIIFIYSSRYKGLISEWMNQPITAPIFPIKVNNLQINSLKTKRVCFI